MMNDELFAIPSQPAPKLFEARTKLERLHKLIAEIEDETGDWIPDADPLVRQAKEAAELVRQLEQDEADKRKA